MKKFLSILLSVVLCLCICTGCAQNGGNASAESDWKYFTDKGEMIIGITLYEPMNYYDENGVLTGFDTEFAQLVCAKLGITPKFQVIEWEQKEFELNSKTIDCIWNGLTITEERKADMAFSTPYIRNRQVVVIKASNADKFPTIDTMTGVTITAENGSAGEAAIEASEILSSNTYVSSSAQKDVLMEVKAGTSDIGVIDYVMANSSITPDTDYSDLMIVEGVELQAEEYAVGLRISDTDTLAKINAAIAELVEDGSLKALAEKYDLLDVYAFDK